MSTAAVSDPLLAIREYRQLAPWSLRDLATVAGAVLDASGIRPINAAASAYPNERTIRFYVTRGLVTPPDGRGTAATYSYRHLLQVLAIKLRQMEGATLATITKELAETTGDVLERRVASALGPGVPLPSRLPLTANDEAPRGRAGRALRTLLSRPEPEPTQLAGGRWFRMAVAHGLELLVHEDHPLARRGVSEADVSDAIRLVTARLLGEADRRPQDTPAGVGGHASASEESA
jgi:DNA-binding transcriptional MerR regulator